MATPDKVWSKALAEEVQREEDASDANVDAFHRSDKSLLFDKAIQGVSLVSLVSPRASRLSDRARARRPKESEREKEHAAPETLKKPPSVGASTSCFDSYGHHG